MLTNNITNIRKIFKHMHSCENNKYFLKHEFSHKFSKVEEFAYVQFCK